MKYPELSQEDWIILECQERIKTHKVIRQADTVEDAHKSGMPQNGFAP